LNHYETQTTCSGLNLEPGTRFSTTGPLSYSPMISENKLSRIGPGQSLDGRPDAAGSGVGGPVGGTLSSGLKNIPMPQGSDTGLCRMPFFGWDIKRVS
jgi:hypothetical protein